MKEQRGSGALDRRNSRGVSAVPGPVTSWVLASVSVLVIATSYWLALQPGAAEVQTGFVKWINDPPQPLGAVLAVTNSLFRPVPLAVVALALFGWMMFTARGKSRWEVLRAIVISFVLSEVITQILKRVAGQARPTASIPGLDVHGYPKDPYGNAYPSAHTSVVVGLVHGAMALADLAATSRRAGRRGSRGAQSPVYRGALARRRGRGGGHRAALGVGVLAGGGEMAHPPWRHPPWRPPGGGRTSMNSRTAPPVKAIGQDTYGSTKPNLRRRVA